MATPCSLKREEKKIRNRSEAEEYEVVEDDFPRHLQRKGQKRGVSGAYPNQLRPVLTDLSPPQGCTNSKLQMAKRNKTVCLPFVEKVRRS